MIFFFFEINEIVDYEVIDTLWRWFLGFFFIIFLYYTNLLVRVSQKHECL